MNNINLMQNWFLDTPYGSYILKKEIEFYKKNIQNIYGYYGLQIYFEKINLLESNTIKNKYILNKNLRSSINLLPFDSNSIDLIVCPHLLGLIEDYKYFLQECQRVLISNGKLIITSFNSKFLFNLIKLNKKEINYKTINLDILIHQLKILNFNITNGEFFCYNPSLNLNKKIINPDTIDKIGNRWFPTLSSNFGIVAIKYNIPLNNIIDKQQFVKEIFIPSLINAKT